MDFKGVLRPGQACFFVTLRTRGKEGVFDAHPDWKTYVEGLWRRVMADYEAVDGAEFNVNGRSLHAVVFVMEQRGRDARERGALALLREALETFQEASEEGWKAYLEERALEVAGALWEADIEARPIERQEELDGLREFIVQKMLGGEELSDLGLDDDEEDSFFD